MRRSIFPNVILLTGEKNFSFAINYLDSRGEKFTDEIADNMVNSEIEKFIIKSELFREAQAEQKLIPYVKDILKKIQMRDESKDVSIYPFGNF